MNLTLLTVFCALALLAGAQETASTPFRAKSATRTGTIRLQGPASQVFPLFGPVLEKLWAPGWNPEVVYPAGTDVAEGMVFITHSEHGDSTWLIANYNPEALEVTYAVVTPGVVATRINVRCRPVSDKETEVSVSYSHTGLSDKGNSLVDEFTGSAMAKKMAHWTDAINHHLRTGKTIEHY